MTAVLASTSGKRWSNGELIALALSVGVAICFYAHILWFPSSFDAQNYLDIATDIVSRGLFNKFFYSDLRPYGYPWLLSGLLRLSRSTGIDWGLLIFFSQLALHITAGLVVRSALLKLVPGVARGVFIALVLNVFALVYTPESLTESVSASCLTLGSGFWLHQLSSPNDKLRAINLLLGGLFMGFAVMVRPANIFCLPAWLIAGVASCLVLCASSRGMALGMVAVLIGVSLPMLPQIENNRNYYGKTTALVAAPLGQLQQAWGIRYLKYATALPPVPNPSIFYNNPLAQGTLIDEGHPLSWYGHYPGRGSLTLALHIFSVLDWDLLFTYSRDLNPWYRFPVTLLGHAEVALSLLGMVLLVRRTLRTSDRRLGLSVLALSVFLLGHVVVHAPATSEMRFGLPLFLIVGPMAMWTARELAHVRVSWRPGAIAFVVIYVAAALTLSSWVRHQAPSIRAWSDAAAAKGP